MAVVLKLIYEHYNGLMDSYADPRTENYFLIQNPLLPISICVVYFMFVNKWGPWLMKDRPAFKIDLLVAAYDFAQILLCARSVYLGAKHTYIFGSYKFQCEPVDYTNSVLGLLIAKEVHYYFLLKLVDLLDTVFFVLRKKQRQVSFLHVYHHISMVLATWTAVRFIAGGHVVFVGFVNSFVHMVMYSYYLMSIFRKSNAIWWKKYITLLQIFQFGIIALHWAIMLLGPSCGFPKKLGLLFLPQNIFITSMFVDFYYKAYIKNKKA